MHLQHRNQWMYGLAFVESCLTFIFWLVCSNAILLFMYQVGLIPGETSSRPTGVTCGRLDYKKNCIDATLAQDVGRRGTTDSWVFTVVDSVLGIFSRKGQCRWWIPWSLTRVSLPSTEQLWSVDRNRKDDAVWSAAFIEAFFPAGLYDMMGNTWEWTSTKFPGAQPMYVLRGASWIDTVDGSANHRARVTTRWVT